MIKQNKKIDTTKAMAAAQRAADFWATIDGNKLAQVGQREKERDLVGPTKKAEYVKLG
ncbi:hypothetical protein [Leclercia sp.]|uniref:hypothetical protein n=1 Tax=Leclercia sp. TaxID=1898428 RepID=UPI0018EAB1E4|nr:hypothetical protein [Leclercia sp.]